MSYYLCKEQELKYKQIPTFSLSDLLNPNFPKDEFRECIEKLGAFYLKDHNIHKNYHDDLVNVTTDFFKWDDEEQNKFIHKNSQSRRGFSCLGGESTAVVTNTGSYSDLSMCFSMGRDNNVFPSENFEEIYGRYFDSTYELALEIWKQIIKASCENIDIKLDYDPLFRFRLFPEVTKERCAEIEPLRMAPHYDISMVTIIQQTACENGFVSLQCESETGIIEIPHKQNCVVVNCGAVATIVTNGKVKAPIHSVKSPAKDMKVGSDRTSSVMFLRPTSEFEFSVSQAKANGIEVALEQERASFGEWMGVNYVNMRT